jgi:tetratricopeptide (TPR) repeat protein
VRTQPEFAQVVASIKAAGGPAGAAASNPAQAARLPADDRARIEQDRATSFLVFGMIETAFDRKAQARQSLEQALAIHSLLATADPKNERRQANLRIVEESLENLLWNDGRLAQAREVFARRIASLEQEIQQNPQNHDLAAKLANAHRAMANGLSGVALWEEAAPHYAAALKSPSNDSDSPAYTEILAPAVHLLVGDDDAYRSGCAQIFKKYGADANVEQAARVARLFALQPVNGDKLAKIVALAEKARNNWHAYTYALVRYRAGRFEDAIQTIVQARTAKAYESILVDNFVLAMAHFQSGRHDQAREFLNAVNGLSPKSMPVWTHIASSMLDVDWIVLRREANQLILGSPYSVDDRLRRSRAFTQLNELGKAEAEAAALVKALPDDPRGYVAHARVLAMDHKQQAVQQLKKAEGLLDRLVGGSAVDVDFWRMYGDTLSLLKRPEEASRAIRHAVIAQALVVLKPRPSNADRALMIELYTSLFDAMHAAGREQEALTTRTELQHWLSICRLRPLLASADDLLAESSGQQPASHQLIAAIDQLLATNDKSLGKNDPLQLHVSARLHQRRAELLQDDGRPEKEVVNAISAARAQYERLLVADPKNEEAVRRLADIRLSHSGVVWTILEPVKLSAKAGTTLALLSDGSILASGASPRQETCTVVVKPGLARITAVRLETLPHPSLPRGGSGRDPNGSFSLNEFTLSWTAPGDSSGRDPVPLKIRSAVASFQRTFETGGPSPIEGAIDGQLTTDWEPWPEVYRRQEAIFELEPSAETMTASNLVVQLTSIGRAGRSATPGRFRLSVTDAPKAYQSEDQRLQALKVIDPWARLAAAIYLLGDQQALDRLLAHHPAAAAGIGEMYALDKNWERAVAEYNKAITPETKNARPLAKRAEAYEKLKKWDLAVADWTRASQQQPDVAFDRFKPAGTESWRLQLQNGGAGSMEVVDETLVFSTTVATGTGWHVQAYQAPLHLENGVEYVIRLKMKSPDSCSVTLAGGINQEDWHLIGLNETFVPPSEFRDYEFAFVPHDVVPGNNAIKFDLGTSRGSVMVKEIVILKGQSPQAYAKALAETPDQNARARILDEAEQFPDVMTALRRSLPDDPAVEEAYRRMAVRTAGPNAPACRGLLVALDQHRRGQKDQALLAFRKAAAAIQPIGANAFVRELVRDALREFGTDGPEVDMLLAAATGEPPATLAEAVRKHPDQFAGYLARGDWYDGRGLWRKAADDFTAAYRLQPDVMTGMRLGILLAGIGEVDRYRDHCQSLVDRFAGTNDHLEAERTLKTCCLLGPGPVGDPTRLARLAEVAVSGDPSQPIFVWLDLARALYEFRLGRFDAAVATSRANRARVKAVGGGDEAVAAVIAVEAMALYRSGDAWGARRSLSDAKKRIADRRLARHGGDVVGHDWLAAHLLFREAETMAESALAKAKRLPALLKGEDKPADNPERLAFAQIAFDQKQFAAAVRLWAEALARDPKRGDDRQAQHRYNAARAAALAAAGLGRDEPPPDDAANVKLRGQALAWLKAELTAWRTLYDSGRPQERPTILQTLSHWQKDTDLAGIREPSALAKLPAGERNAFTQLWAEVAALMVPEPTQAIERDHANP